MALRLQRMNRTLEILLANEQVVGIEGGECKERYLSPRQSTAQRRENPDQREVEGPLTLSARQPGSLVTDAGTESAAETTESSSGVRISASNSPRAHSGAGSSGESRLTA
jgi:hypothetical protein